MKLLTVTSGPTWPGNAPLPDVGTGVGTVIFRPVQRVASGTGTTIGESIARLVVTAQGTIGLMGTDYVPFQLWGGVPADGTVEAPIYDVEEYLHLFVGTPQERAAPQYFRIQPYETVGSGIPAGTWDYRTVPENAVRYVAGPEVQATFQDIRDARALLADAQVARQALLDGVVGVAALSGELATITADAVQSQRSLIQGWAAGQAYQIVTPTRSATGLLTTATVLWPDGSAGVYTGTSYDATNDVYLGYTVTHAGSGTTVTQPPVTLDAGGNVTSAPALTLSPAGAVTGSAYDTSGSTQTMLNAFRALVNTAQRTGTPVNIGAIGDSTSAGGVALGYATWVDGFRDRLQSILGDGGRGYTGLTPTDTNNAGNGALTYQTPLAANGMDQVITIPPAGLQLYSPVGRIIDGTSTGWILRIKENVREFDTLELFYLQQPSGGTFDFGKVKADATLGTGAKVTGVATANAATALTSVTVPGWRDNTIATDRRFSILNTSGKLTFVGVNETLGTTGARIHKLALGGLKAQDIALTTPAAYAYVCTRLALDLAVIALGINDTAVPRTADQYEANIRTIIANVRAGRPTCLILLCAQQDTATASQVTTLNTYRGRLQKIAVDTAGVGYCDWRDWLGTYAAASVQGWMFDNVHTNTAGSDLIGQRMYELLGGGALRRPAAATAIT